MLFCLLAVLVLVGCGQRGDLYLPEKPAEQTQDS
jgi:predicted small lipoprotein YifL